MPIKVITVRATGFVRCQQPMAGCAPIEALTAGDADQRQIDFQVSSELAKLPIAPS
jgi:hypothetical protein